MWYVKTLSACVAHRLKGWVVLQEFRLLVRVLVRAKRLADLMAFWVTATPGCHEITSLWIEGFTVSVAVHVLGKHDSYVSYVSYASAHFFIVNVILESKVVGISLIEVTQYVQNFKFL